MTCPWAQYCEKLKDQDRFKSAAADFPAKQKRTSATTARAAARVAAATGASGDGPATE